MRGGIIMSDRRYLSDVLRYELCPHCGKKLFRIAPNSDYEHIFVWCKNCKKEIEVSKRAKEPRN